MSHNTVDLDHLCSCLVFTPKSEEPTSLLQRFLALPLEPETLTSDWHAVEHPPRSYPLAPWTDIHSALQGEGLLGPFAVSEVPNPNPLHEGQVRLVIEADDDCSPNSAALLAELRGLFPDPIQGNKVVTMIWRTCTRAVEQTKKDKASGSWVPPRARYEVDVLKEECGSFAERWSLLSVGGQVDLLYPLELRPMPGAYNLLLSDISSPADNEAATAPAVNKQDPDAAHALFDSEAQDIADEESIDNALTRIDQIELEVTVDFRKFEEAAAAMRLRGRALTAVEQEQLAVRSVKSAFRDSSTTLKSISVYVTQSDASGPRMRLEHKYKVMLEEEDYVEILASIPDLPHHLTFGVPRWPLYECRSVGRPGKRSHDVALGDHQDQVDLFDAPPPFQRRIIRIRPTTAIAFTAGMAVCYAGLSAVPVDAMVQFCLAGP